MSARQEVKSKGGHEFKKKKKRVSREGGIEEEMMCRGRTEIGGDGKRGR